MKYKPGDRVGVDSYFKLTGWSYGVVIFPYWKNRYFVKSYDGYLKCAGDKTLRSKKFPHWITGKENPE